MSRERTVVLKDEEFCHTAGEREGEKGEERVLVLITVRSFAVQLEPSNWILSWSRGDDGSVDKTGYRPSQ